jgi:hypothetical protein
VSENNSEMPPRGTAVWRQSEWEENACRWQCLLRYIFFVYERDKQTNTNGEGILAAQKNKIAFGVE